MHYSWQSWGSSLVSSTAFDFFLSLATVLTHTELDVFAEQACIFFADVEVSAVVPVDALSPCPGSTLGLDQSFFLWVHLEVPSPPSAVPWPGSISPSCSRGFSSSRRSQLCWKICPCPSWLSCPVPSWAHGQLSPGEPALAMCFEGDKTPC